MQWDAPGVVLSVRPFGEADAIAAVFTEAHGRHLGLARGGAGRRQAGMWQPGNLVQASWVGRLADQLGSFSAELVHAGAALAMDDPLALAMLSACCGVADGALAEREPHPAVFGGLVRLIAALSDAPAALPGLVHWEAGLLADLGYGLDLSRCAVTGGFVDLAFVSPKTGRAVARDAAGVWQSRLLPLPAFLLRGAPASLHDLADGLRLTGHFLARDAFAAAHRPLPPARAALYDRVARMAEETNNAE